MKPGLTTKPDLLSMLRRRRTSLKDHMSAHALTDVRSLVSWCEANGFRPLDEALVSSMLPTRVVKTKEAAVEVREIPAPKRPKRKKKSDTPAPE